MSGEKQALRELMAAAFYNSSAPLMAMHNLPPPRWPLTASPALQSAIRQQAGVVMAALAEAGYAIVPVEPTRKMWAAVNIVEPVGSGRNRVINLVSAEGWRAMLAAARLAE